MYKCALCKKEVNKIKKFRKESMRKSVDKRGGNTLIVLDLCDECYDKISGVDHES